MPETMQTEGDDRDERRVWQRPCLKRLLGSDAENFEGDSPDGTIDS